MLPKRTFLKFVISCFAPVILVNLALSPLWFTHLQDIHSWIPTLQLLFTGLIIPVYLAIIGVRFIWDSTGMLIFYVFGILLSSVLLAFLLDYTVWGASTGMFWNPDAETLMLLSFVGKIALGIALIPQLFAIVFKTVTRHVHRTT